MTDTCTYPIDRGETLIAYLYDDIDSAARTRFEAHLITCAVCRDELDALRGTRGELAGWLAPEPKVAFPMFGGSSNVEPPTAEPRTANREPRRSWRELPAWAQVAAAMLFLGVSAGVANLDVRYDSNGLSVRTGWSKPAAVTGGTAAPAAGAVTRTELAALEQELRSELRAVQASSRGPSVADATSTRPISDADVLRRARALVDESEKRQRTELALRVGELLRDVNAQRQADLVRIDRSLGLVENNLGVEVLKQRQQVNYLMRVNQRQ
jgi:anti-sigma factor RsiW